jgi:hypothetical protein
MKEQIEKLIKYYNDLYEECHHDQFSNPYTLLAKMSMCEEFVSDLKGLLRDLDQNAK